MGVPGEEGVSRHELAGDAEAALDGALVEERLLERAEDPVDGQPLDRRDGGAVSLDREDEAGVDGAPVDEDGARAALADEAALLGAGEPEVVAQDVEQGVVGGDLEGAPAPVDGDLDRNRVVISSLPRCQPIDRDPQRAGAQDAEHRQAVVGARPHRARRRAGAREHRLEDRGLRVVRGSGIGEDAALVDDEHGPRADAAVGQPRHPGLVHAAAQGHRREVVAPPARPAHVGSAHPPRRQRQLDRA